MIPMVDLKGQYLAIKDEIDSNIQGVLESSHFILGPNVHAFEKEAADYLKVKHAIGCASGTDALHLALAALGIQAGDEVITSTFTFIATAEAICYLGAVPVFVDIDPQTFNLDLNQVEAAISDKTRALLPVHLFGQPVDMQAINTLASKHDLLVVEDCAQSFGAEINGEYTGALSAAGCFSFFPSKNLGCFGDGGLITTNDNATAERLKVLRNHGSEERYHHSMIGYNSRLDELQAAILRPKLKRMDDYNQGRRRVAKAYAAGLAGLPLEIPFEDGIGTHVYHQYTLLSDRRDEIMAALQAQQISCAVYYPIPLHQQSVFNDQPSLPVSESVAARCLSLPVYPELEQEKIERICGVIRARLA
ncbi:MAG: DegT/DnrJ/EryC1/StrS family aminotransferase [Gammaproteobacteria bacterium]|nr:DegT/DnrJ/EryC1/StrS family aminotransferase [Gammaproteobacteria bacterium]